MSTNINGTTPAAPSNSTNVVWQTDGSGNVSGYVPTSALHLPGVDLTAQAANISATDFVAAAAVLNGVYRISIIIQETQAASSSSTLPSVVLTWTDEDNSTLQTFTLTPASPSGNTLTTYGQATLIVNSKVGFAIQYATSSYASSGGTPMQYALNLHVEYLG